MTNRIYLHTHGRIDRQLTISALPPRILDQLTVVIQERERGAWDWKFRHSVAPYDVEVLPDEIRTLSPTRQWILENAVAKNYEKIVILDDDLRFSRRTGEGTKLETVVGENVAPMFDALFSMLDDYVHVAVSAREGNNHHTDNVAPWRECGRVMRVLGYRPKKVLELGCRFDHIRSKQDFDLTLQLLELGYPNWITYQWAQDQAGSQAKGGCAVYRTPATMAEDAQKLHDLHPQFVKVVTKTTKGAWGGGDRVDVQIAWKKALEHGLSVRFKDNNEECES
jgi:hypothetical protein